MNQTNEKKDRQLFRSWGSTSQYNIPNLSISTFTVEEFSAEYDFFLIKVVKVEILPS